MPARSKSLIPSIYSTNQRSKFGSKIGGRSTNGSSKTAKTDRRISRRMVRSSDPAEGVVVAAEATALPRRRPAVAEAKVTIITSRWWWPATVSATRRTTTATCRAISNWKIPTIRWITSNTFLVTIHIIIKPLDQRRQAASNNQLTRGKIFSHLFGFFFGLEIFWIPSEFNVNDCHFVFMLDCVPPPHHFLITVCPIYRKQFFFRPIARNEKKKRFVSFLFKRLIYICPVYTVSLLS